MARTTNEWKKAVESGEKHLKDVPPEERTLDICIAAIKKSNDFFAFLFVPEAVRRNQKVWDVAYAEYACGFAEVPEEFRTPEMCAAAMEAWPLNLRWVPDALKTPEACEAAFARDARAAFFVPDAMKTKKMQAAEKRLQKKWIKARTDAQAPQPTIVQFEGRQAFGGHVKVRSVSFLAPGTRFLRCGEVEEHTWQQAENLGPEDIVVTEWGGDGNPEWQFQTFRHAALTSKKWEDKLFNPDLYNWDKGVKYAWNCVCSMASAGLSGFGAVSWRRFGKPKGDEEEELMSCMSGCWTELPGAGFFPMQFGDLWHAFGRSDSAIAADVSEYSDESLLRDALRWANPGIPGFGRGKAEVLANLALDSIFDPESQIEAWFADELGEDAWQRLWKSGHNSAWIHEDASGGVAMEIAKSKAEGTDLEQIFADRLEWGAIVYAVHYGNYCPESGREMDAEVHDMWAEWAVGGVASRGDGD